MARKAIRSIEDLTPDPQNANKGTEKGARFLEESLREHGAGRSILADRNGVVIAGNKTLEQAASLGIPVRTVHTRGEELVVVVREDLDLIEDPDLRARSLAYYDNRVGQLDLEWDIDQLLEDLDAGVPGLDELFPNPDRDEGEDEEEERPKADGRKVRKLLKGLLMDLEAMAEEGILPTGQFVEEDVKGWAAEWISTIHATGEV